jgi:hypothetical protein
MGVFAFVSVLGELSYMSLYMKPGSPTQRHAIVHMHVCVCMYMYVRVCVCAYRHMGMHVC